MMGSLVMRESTRTYCRRALNQGEAIGNLSRKKISDRNSWLQFRHFPCCRRMRSGHRSATGHSKQQCQTRPPANMRHGQRPSDPSTVEGMRVPHGFQFSRDKLRHRKKHCADGRSVEWRSAHDRPGIQIVASCFLSTQRNPTWLVEVSTGSAWRAAGRYRRQ